MKIRMKMKIKEKRNSESGKKFNVTVAEKNSVALTGLDDFYRCFQG